MLVVTITRLRSSCAGEVPPGQAQSLIDRERASPREPLLASPSVHYDRKTALQGELCEVLAVGRGLGFGGQVDVEPSPCGLVSGVDQSSESAVLARLRRLRTRAIRTPPTLAASLPSRRTLSPALSSEPPTAGPPGTRTPLQALGGELQVYRPGLPEVYRH